MALTLRPISGPGFVNREALIDELSGGLVDPYLPRGFYLTGARKVGATSFWRECARRIEEKSDRVVIHFELDELVEESLLEFLQELTIRTLNAYGAAINLRDDASTLFRGDFSYVKEAIRGLEVDLKLADDIEYLLSLRHFGMSSPMEALENGLLLPEKLGASTHRPNILILDELPRLLSVRNGKRLGDEILARINGLIPGFTNTLLCVSASNPRLMAFNVAPAGLDASAMFEERSLEPLNSEYVKQILEENLDRHLADDAYEMLTLFTGGLPHYVHLLGMQLSQSEAYTISGDILEGILHRFLSEQGDLLFRPRLMSLSPFERRIVLSMSGMDLSRLSEVAKALSESLNAVGRILTYIEEKGVLIKAGRGAFRFADPVFRTWLSFRYGPASGRIDWSVMEGSQNGKSHAPALAA